MSVLDDVTVLRPRSGTAVVEFTGDHDLVTKQEVAELLEHLIDANELVVMDISEARFVDSSFLANILVADRLSKERSKRLVLQPGTNLMVARAIELSGILLRVDHADTRAEALEQ